MPNASLKKAGAWKPAGRAKCWPVPASERQRDSAKVSVRPAAVFNASSYQFKEDPSPPRRLARPARLSAAASAQAGRPVPAGCHRALHLRTVSGCGPAARLRKRADRLRGALWQAGWGGGFGLAAGFSRVGQGRGGLAAAQFPPAPPARAASPRQRPCAWRTPPDLCKKCLLTPSARSGRMGLQWLRAKSSSPSPAQRQVQAGAPESKFLSVTNAEALSEETLVFKRPFIVLVTER